MRNRWTTGLWIAIAMAIAGCQSGVALAAPTLQLVWSGTTGSGTTGGTTIDAVIGDELTLDVIVTIDAEGFTGAQWDLLGSVGLVANANSLVPASGGPPECPAPPQIAPGTCFSATFRSFTPIWVGVVDSGSSTVDYDIVGLTPEYTPSQMTIGRGVFVVHGGASSIENVSTHFIGGDGVTDGNFDPSVPPTDTAWINVLDATPPAPEASRSYLLGTTGSLPDIGVQVATDLVIGPSGETSFHFDLDAPADVHLFFTAECAVASTDSNTWLDVDLLVDGSVIAPTSHDDALCTSTGNGLLNRWVSVGRDAATSLAAGAHEVRVRARLAAGLAQPGEQWLLDDKSLVLLVKTEDD